MPGACSQKVGSPGLDYLASVFQGLDSAIHQINHYPVNSVILVSVILIRWIVPVDSTIQRLNNRGLMNTEVYHPGGWAVSHVSRLECATETGRVLGLLSLKQGIQFHW